MKVRRPAVDGLLSGLRFFFSGREFLAAALVILTIPASAQQIPSPLELSRPVRSWEFLPVAGTRAALLGSETGKLEAWVYPLKLFRDLHLTFHIGDRALPAESLARTVTVRPESASILYAGDSFRVRETECAPVDEAGAVIVLDIETEQPMEVEVAFTEDFQLQWPAALGGTFSYWDDKRRAVVLEEETRKFAALFGSPSATDPHLAYETNYSSSEEDAFRLGIVHKGRESRVLVLAASVAGVGEAAKTYQRLSATYADLMQKSAAYYRDYLQRTVGLELPDARLQSAYDWARISTIQGLVNNPYLGTGLVAGYRTSGTSQRPGFAWFFGRDSLWTSFALNSEGDYATTRTALDFLSKFQREDGKIPHEISQSASLVPWFKDYPFPYVSADATPLFIIAMNDYATESGDVGFVREKWDNLWRAYKFLQSTYDAHGLAKNVGVGHGWVEGGPLLPVKNEHYQAGLGVEAAQALSNLARLAGDSDLSQQLAKEFDRSRAALEQAFWSQQNQSYVFGLKPDDEQVNEISVLSAVPMWFGLADANHADDTITRLESVDHQADWGMRIISQQSPVYDGSGYHFGSVWPLFTGWAAVAEYRYHRPWPAYANLRDNALLAFDGSLGHFTEVLSGDYYQSFETSSPHQIWSAAMVISPMLRGMFGLKSDAEAHEVTLAPHLPATWTEFALSNVRMGSARVDFRFHKTTESVVLEVTRQGADDGWVTFSPAFSLRTEIISASLNGRALPFQVKPNANDKHVSVRFPLKGGANQVVIHVKNDFGLTLSNDLPSLGSKSREMRLISESWNSTRTEVTLKVTGLAGNGYELRVWNPAQIVSAEGAALDQDRLQIQMPQGPAESYVEKQVVLHFGKS